jgi:hypothetical protein
MKKVLTSLLPLLLILSLLAGCVPAAKQPQAQPTQQPEAALPELVLLTPEPAEEGPEEAPATAEVSTPTPGPAAAPEPTATPIPVSEDGIYDSRDEVALYLHLYGHLPSNYITKKQAEKLGWPGGSLEPYAPGKCIGGGRFGNYEGLLPNAKGRQYYECDIGTLGARSRGAKRLIYSNDGLIYYTDDHYESFTLLYGEE